MHYSLNFAVLERDGSPNPKDKIRPGSHRFDRNFSHGFLQYVPISLNIYRFYLWRPFAIRHLKFAVQDAARQGLLLPDRLRSENLLICPWARSAPDKKIHLHMHVPDVEWFESFGPA